MFAKLPTWLKHLAKRVGPLPGDRKCADAAARNAADRVALRIVREWVILVNCGQNFGDQKLGVVVAERVVFKAAILRLRIPAGLRRQFIFLVAWVDKYADRHRHVALVDEIVEHDGHAEIAVLVDVRVAVLKDHQRGRLRRIVLLRHINVVAANRAGKHFAVFPDMRRDFALRHAVLPK